MNTVFNIYMNKLEHNTDTQKKAERIRKRRQIRTAHKNKKLKK